MARVLCLLTVLVLASAARADEEKLPLDKLPKVVADGFKKRFPKAAPIDAAKETEDGKTTYEVSFKDDGKHVDTTFTPEGVLTLIEKEIDAAKLPKAVTEAAANKYPDAKTKLIEEVTVVKDGKEEVGYYELQLETADKKAVEVQVKPDGTIQKTEDKTGKKD